MVLVNRPSHEGTPTFLFRLWHPMSWSRGMRRTFMLLLPLALPVWILLNLAGAGAIVLRDLGGALDKYWNGRQRRYHRYDPDSAYTIQRRDDDGLN